MLKIASSSEFKAKFVGALDQPSSCLYYREGLSKLFIVFKIVRAEAGLPWAIKLGGKDPVYIDEANSVLDTPGNNKMWAYCRFELASSDYPNPESLEETYFELVWQDVNFIAIGAYAGDSNFESHMSLLSPRPYVMYLLDASGSMADDKDELTSGHVEVLRSWAELFGGEIGAAVLRASNVEVCDKSFDPYKIDDVLSFIGDDISYGGNSPIGELVFSGAESMGGFAEDVVKTIVLFTDGKENSSSIRMKGGPGQEWPPGMPAANKFMGSNIRLVVVAYGELPDDIWQDWRGEAYFEECDISDLGSLGEFHLDQLPNAVVP